MDFRIGGASRVVRATTNTAGGGSASLCSGSASITNTTCSSTRAGTWRDYRGSFTWNGPTSLQQFGFAAVSTASGNTGDGNFLDQIQLTISPLVEFMQQTTSHAESGTTSNLPQIRLSGNLRAPISVMVSIVGGTAELDEDFTTPSGTSEFAVNIPAGTYSGRLFNLGISVIEDAEREEDETIEFEILPDPSYRLSSTRTCGGDPFHRSTHTILEESIEITKTGTHDDANGNGRPDAGETLSYDFVVSNTGSVDLSQITVTDLSPQVTVTGGPISLAAGASNDTAFKGTYTLTQADLDAGSFENQASVSGRVPATGLTITDLSDDPDDPADVDTEDDGEPDDPTILELPSSPAYTLEKSSTVIDVNGNGRPDAGDKIDYTFTVENTGNVTLSNITVSDPQVTFSNDTLATLAPDQSDTSIRGTYTITQADMDAGKIENSATSTASPPEGAPLTVDSSPPGGGAGSPTVTELRQESQIDLLKEAEHQDTDGDGVVDVGEKILYRFTVENTGNVTLTDISIEDDKATVTGGPLASLQPGNQDATTFTGEYTIAQEDADAGFFENVAMVKGLDPANVEVTARSHGLGGEPGDPTSFVIPSSAALQVFKTGSFEPADDINGNGFPDPGELVRFKFKVVNSGNVTLSNITINDPDASIAGGPIASLPSTRSDTVTFTGTHVLRLEEVNAGQAINQATVHGIAPNGTTASDLSDDPDNTANEDLEGDGEPDDPTIVRIPQNPSLLAEKSSSFQGAPSGTAKPGDTILYTVTVTNTGSVTVYDVSTKDPGPTFGGKPATGTLSAFSPNALDIDPGEKGHFSATYTLTSADLSNAQNNENGVQNSATATGTGPKGQNVESPPSEPATVTLPGYLISKTADVSEVQRGESLFYTISLKSIGQAAPIMVDVVDEFPASFVYVPGSSTLDGEVLTPEIEGRKLIFKNITLQPDEEREIRLGLSVSSTAAPDDYTNRAWAEEPGKGIVSGFALSTVEVVSETLFDCSDLLGKVFDDKNQNGYQDNGEIGIPGARVASAKGLLITSDDHGRFHVPCAELPDSRIGTNYALKLDTRSLPSGYRLTTENPRVVRLTSGKASKFSFGATIGRVVRVDLADGAFIPGREELRSEWHDQIHHLIAILESEPSILRLSYAGNSKRLAQRRLKAMRKFIESEWRKEGGRYRLEIEARVQMVGGRPTGRGLN